MKTKIIQVDTVKASIELIRECPLSTEHYINNFVSSPIRLNDKRRNPSKYHVTEYGITRYNGDDFVKDLANIYRVIKYKSGNNDVPVFKGYDL